MRPCASDAKRYDAVQFAVRHQRSARITLTCVPTADRLEARTYHIPGDPGVPLIGCRANASIDDRHRNVAQMLRRIARSFAGIAPAGDCGRPAGQQFGRTVGQRNRLDGASERHAAGHSDDGNVVIVGTVGVARILDDGADVAHGAARISGRRSGTDAERGALRLEGAMGGGQDVQRGDQSAAAAMDVIVGDRYLPRKVFDGNGRTADDASAVQKGAVIM